MLRPLAHFLIDPVNLLLLGAQLLEWSILKNPILSGSSSLEKLVLKIGMITKTS